MDDQTFKDHMWNFNKYGFTLVSLVFGHELGFFDVMKNANKHLSSSELASLAGMKERYVREWLGGMVAGSIVHLDTETGKYYVPEQRFDTIAAAASLGRGVNTCFRRFDLLKSFFKEDGPWGCDFDVEDFWQFFGGMRDNSSDGVINHDVMPSLKSVDGLTAKLETGIDILDLGCGSGSFTISLAKNFPQSRFTGIDISEKGLKRAQDNLRTSQLSNVKFLKLDGNNASSQLKDQFDIVMIFDALHDFPDPRKALIDVQQLLKADGILIIFEARPHSSHGGNIGDMLAARLFTISTFFCLPCSLSGEPRHGIGRCWGEQELMKTVGEYFSFVAKSELPGLQGLYFYSSKHRP